MSTSWTILNHAHDEEIPHQQRQLARQEFFQRYEAVVRRYLRGLLRHWPQREEAVDECLHAFALRFMKGAFRNAQPQRGRFRDYLKQTLRNLAVDYQRQKASEFVPLENVEVAVEDPSPESDEAFLKIWREELISRALKALADEEQKQGKHLYTVLRQRMDHPDMHSPEMAEALSAVIGKTVTAEWVRKRLMLARQRLAGLVLEELKQTLDNPTSEEIEQELIDAGLMEYCRDALDK